MNIINKLRKKRVYTKKFGIHTFKIINVSTEELKEYVEFCISLNMGIKGTVDNVIKRHRSGKIKDAVCFEHKILIEKI